MGNPKTYPQSEQKTQQISSEETTINLTTRGLFRVNGRRESSPSDDEYSFLNIRESSTSFSTHYNANEEIEVTQSNDEPDETINSSELSNTMNEPENSNPPQLHISRRPHTS